MLFTCFYVVVELQNHNDIKTTISGKWPRPARPRRATAAGGRRTSPAAAVAAVAAVADTGECTLYLLPPRRSARGAVSTDVFERTRALDPLNVL